MKFFFLLAAGLAGTVFAGDELITEVSASQNWPWSPEVNIAYRYNGANPTSVWFTATWQGQTNPVDVVQLKATGVYLVGNGRHCLKWDPALAGYGTNVLVNFKVVGVVTNADPRTYLVVDLKNGGYSTLGAVPAGGWTDEYKQTKMVFRRIPAGTYQIGTSEKEYRAAFPNAGGSSGQAGSQGRGWELHNITYSSDYYFPIFAMTQSQFSWLTGNKETSSSTPLRPSTGSYTYFTYLRGETLDDGVTAVNWPTTGHKVNATSFVGMFRARTSKLNQEELLADLPTDQQWTFAMTAGKNTFLPSGGTKDDSDKWQTYFETLCYSDPANHDVGLLGCNDFGIYDFNVHADPCLDWMEAGDPWFVDGAVPYFVDKGDRIDHPGSATPTYLKRPADDKYRYYRISCGSTGKSTIDRTNTIFSRNAMDVSDFNKNNWIARLVINLKPIVNVD